MDRVFGYGSLVNRLTHGHGGTPMEVGGWRRAWRRTPLRAHAFLTAVPAAGARIAGLAAPVPAGGWAALDRREHAYARVMLPEGPALYAIPEGGHDAPTEANPILLSYLDTVLQGYLREFGERGVWAFADTTDGWDAPVHDDRAAPLYPRATSLEPGERRFVDRVLAFVG